MLDHVVGMTSITTSDSTFQGESVGDWLKSRMTEFTQDSIKLGMRYHVGEQGEIYN